MKERGEESEATDGQMEKSERGADRDNSARVYRVYMF